MMRPWLVWTLFAACFAVVLAAMGWASATVLRLDKAQAAARQQAAVEENVRLALWRMDSALAPVIARESTWPYFAYAPFYPVQRAYTNMLLPVLQGEILMPSPLLSGPAPEILLHFQIDPDGTFNSPQVPSGKMRELAVGSYTTPEVIATAGERLKRLATRLTRERLIDHLAPPDVSDVQIAVLPREVPPAAGIVTPQAPAQQAAAAPQAGQQAEGYDLAQRQQRQRQQIEIQQMPQPPPSGKFAGDLKAREYNVAMNTMAFSNNGQVVNLPVSGVREATSSLLWLDGHLLLARRVAVNGSEYIQGCWLDWPALQRSLLESIRDLLPGARLEPLLESAQAAAGQRILAALPVRLLPGELPGGMAPPASPLRLSLAVAWLCVLLAAVAVAVLLQGALSLSERRGAFVSAVTHEMRTPLTTFRMYTEMLVKGMVPGEKRTRYLDTLRIEADRLAHLVENVLAYARLERGNRASRSEPLAPAAILGRAQGRLADRAEQAGMRLEVQVDAAGDVRTSADPGAVEQILFNLVDNACKYAAGAEDPTIHVRVRAEGDEVRFEVTDHGPGVDREQRRRLFRPFSKSARQAAHSAPGVGLGLALSRRLARQMGGDLTYEPNGSTGAAFTLRLPRA